MKQNEVIQVPVFLNFEYSLVIGTLNINTKYLPKFINPKDTHDFVFVPTVQIKGPKTKKKFVILPPNTELIELEKYDLLSVSLVRRKKC